MPTARASGQPGAAGAVFAAIRRSTSTAAAYSSVVMPRIERARWSWTTAASRLTTTGREQLAAVRGVRRARFAAAMAGWSTDEQATFAALLARFVAGLEG
jgi:hypothetical protein